MRIALNHITPLLAVGAAAIAIAAAPSSASVGESASQSTCGVWITGPAPARR